MLTWIIENLATILLSLGLIALVSLIIRSRFRNKRKGKCACGCATCSLNDQCHAPK